MDDEEIIRETISSMLKSMGYEVHCVKNSKEAINEVEIMSKRYSSFAAIILDLTIPGETGGKETVCEIRKIDNDVPVFVASGYADDPIMANPTAYGFNDKYRKTIQKG